jgi:hypothetical protein
MGNPASGPSLRLLWDRWLNPPGTYQNYNGRPKHRDARYNSLPRVQCLVRAFRKGIRVAAQEIERGGFLGR